MSVNWDLYNAYMSIDGTTAKDRNITKAKNDFKRGVVDSPALHTVNINDIEVQLLIHSTDIQNQKDFRTMPEDTMVGLGSLVYWNSMHWLITNVDFDSTISKSGHMEQCNRQIQWQNDDGKIISRWCVCSKPYTSNISYNNNFQIPNRQYQIKLPYDSETIKIDLDKRFLLEKINGEAKAYIVTCVDPNTDRYEDLELSGSGFITWNLTQTQFNTNTDNPDLMIADYFKPSDTVYGDTYKSIIVGDDKVKNGIGSKTYSANFFIGEEQHMQYPIWNITAPEGYENDITAIVNNDNTFTISVNAKDDIVGRYIGITLCCDNNDFPEIVKQVKVVGLYG